MHHETAAGRWRDSNCRRLLCVGLVVATGLAMPSFADADAQTVEPSKHDKEFWRAIAKNEYAVPDDKDVFDLVLELSNYLGSPDPELRDTFGYTLPAIWIYRKQLLDADQLRSLIDRLSANLQVDLGESGTPSVLRRSFSALNLSVLAALDNRAPYLEKDEFAALLDTTLNYLAGERDVRGFVTGPGWHHSTAHTADLLKFLARSRFLQPADQGRILDAIDNKFETVGVYTFGEDERLARAVQSLVRREDLDGERFEAWVEAFVVEAKAIWEEDELSPGRFAAVQNKKNLLRALLVLVSSEEPVASEPEVRATLIEALRGI